MRHDAAELGSFSAGPRDAPRRLIDAAIMLFARRGFAGVSMREVSAAARNRNNSAVSYHFAGKAGLIDALAGAIGDFLEPRYDRLLGRLEALPPGALTAYELGLSINAPLFALYAATPNGSDATRVLSRFIQEPVVDLDRRHLVRIAAIYRRFARLLKLLQPDKDDEQGWIHLSHAVMAIVHGLSVIPTFSRVDIAAQGEERFMLFLDYNDYVGGGLTALPTARPPIDRAFWRREIGA